MENRISLLVEQLNMEEHPEGGYYAPAFRSEQLLDTTTFENKRWKGPRSLYSSIYYLLKKGQYSCWHRIASDEMWHFYEGDPIILHVLTQDGTYYSKVLGNSSTEICYQWVVKGGDWFAAISDGVKGYSLAGCSLAPGFDFADFEIGKEEELLEHYRNQETIIHKFLSPLKQQPS